MKLSEYMKAHSLTDQQFADLLGVSRTAVTQYRLGTRCPKPKIMLDICKATGNAVSPTDILLELKDE